MDINKLSKEKIVLIIGILILTAIVFTTKYYGSEDIQDYSDTAKFFSGDYSAKIRSSHSYLYGYMLSPFVGITNSFIAFKIVSIILLLLIIYSVYIIKNKDKRALILILFSPVIWFMGPWISPIQLSSLLFLWAFYFIEKFEKKERLKDLIFSGIFVGLGWCVWDTILFFGILLGIAFLYNKKSYHLLIFVMAITAGLIPRFLLDFYLFNFPLFTILKSSMGTISNTLVGGIYSKISGHAQKNLLNLFSVFLAIPLYYWILYKPGILKDNKKPMVFLTLSLLLVFANPQIRYTLAFVPIMIVMLSDKITKRQFKIQMLFSLIVISLFILPYLIQINNHIPHTGNYFRGSSLSLFISGGFNIQDYFPSEVALEDLNKIIERYPNEVFLVGNHPDDYQNLAHIYWGDLVKEFVSIQDYDLHMKNETILFEKIFMPVPNIQNRRQIWIAGGININENDLTDYDKIRMGISIGEPLDEPNFELIEKYNLLYLYEKK